MIARVARFTFPSIQHRAEAERNGFDRVRPSLARQPGFRAIYFGRTAELEACSISIFESRETNENAAKIMNAQPLLSGQVAEMLPTPASVEFYDVVTSTVRDRVPGAGRLGYLTLSPGQEQAAADHWAVATFQPKLESVPGLCQAYLLRTPVSDGRAALTFWESGEAMARGGQELGRWQAAEASSGRPPAYVGRDAVELTDLLVAIVGVSSTMPGSS